MTIDEAKEEICDLWVALEESVKLQSHYAGLLNQYDGGERIKFNDAQTWVDRLIDLGTIPARRRVRWIGPFVRAKKVGFAAITRAAITREKIVAVLAIVGLFLIMVDRRLPGALCMLAVALFTIDGMRS